MNRDSVNLRRAIALGRAEVVAASDGEIAVSGPHLGDEALVPFRRYVETFGETA